MSTTHAITGAIDGVGTARRLPAVRWNVAGSIVYAWIITIPAAAPVAALTFWGVGLFAETETANETISEITGEASIRDWGAVRRFAFSEILPGSVGTEPAG